jgi:cellobiose-specific phosphotransferase system component IIC
MQYVTSAMLIVVGIIHLLPVSGVLSAQRLHALYGVPYTDPNTLILMRHRAVLFGLLGAFLIYAAFRADVQWLALGAGWVSVLSFVLIARQVGGHNAQVARVVKADWIAAACLLVGTIVRAMTAS